MQNVVQTFSEVQSVVYTERQNVSMIRKFSSSNALYATEVVPYFHHSARTCANNSRNSPNYCQAQPHAQPQLVTLIQIYPATQGRLG